jgi:hypothetical protein
MRFKNRAGEPAFRKNALFTPPFAHFTRTFICNLHPRPAPPAYYPGDLKTLRPTWPWHGTGSNQNIMKQSNATYISKLPPTEAQRAEILRAALLQLLTETETQMLRIEQAFKAFDDQF